MTIKPILQLGNPNLYKISEKIHKSELSDISVVVQDLHDTMMEFKKNYGCGRAIAAPQINIFKRLIYMNIDNRSIVFINPEITYKSDKLYELWDDCMSFPNLMVKVRRHKNIKVKYFDLNWQEHEVEFEGDLSELFQHEYDHLDGILAVMKAIDKKSLSFKPEYLEFYNKL